MSNHIEQIILVLENCDSIKIAGVNIERLAVGNVRTSIFEHGKVQLADNLYVHISPGANVNEYDGFNFEMRFPFDRLSRHRDITAIEVFYQNGDSDFVYLPYDEGDLDHTMSTENTLQKSEVSDDGSLTISIERFNANIQPI